MEVLDLCSKTNPPPPQPLSIGLVSSYLLDFGFRLRVWNIGILFSILDPLHSGTVKGILVKVLSASTL